MILQIEFTWLVGLLIAFLCAVWAFGAVLVKQFDKRLDERFATQEIARTEAQEHWENRFSQIEKLARGTDREMLLMRGDLPNLYTRREDTIRNQSVLEARMDALMNEVKMLRIDGGK
ncbi:MAG: hypothetical protein Q7S51_10180 [Gallionellaceae bacterium]|nr:hypothetical protein [Gallionellaceae bacterium]